MLPFLCLCYSHAIAAIIVIASETLFQPNAKCMTTNYTEWNGKKIEMANATLLVYSMLTDGLYIVAVKCVDIIFDCEMPDFYFACICSTRIASVPDSQFTTSETRAMQFWSEFFSFSYFSALNFSAIGTFTSSFNGLNGRAGGKIVKTWELFVEWIGATALENRV